MNTNIMIVIISGLPIVAVIVWMVWRTRKYGEV